MNILDFLIQQYEYVAWADRHCMASAATVPAEHYHKAFGFSFGCVHNVLVHMLGAQDVWLGRLIDGAERPFLSPTEATTLNAVRDRWQSTHEEFSLYLRSLSAESVQQHATYVRRGVSTSTPRWKVLTHVFDHATYHRGQLNSLIKLAGGTPGDFSYQGLWRQQAGQTL